ncbi:MAG TPA: ClcB-like voltage-gated chloride channel protein [Steroidobacteraceae bacterium]|nr:ClcB-like voltage-gated chloride channel protein [Steroidobacteraceae bacterium]
MQLQAREIARIPLSLLTRLRLILFGHEDLAGIIFWAALVGVCGALASVAFRESIRLLELVFTGQAAGLVNGASKLVWWHRALVPVIGGALAGWVLYILGSRFISLKVADYMEAVLVGDGRISLRGTLLRSASSLLTIGSGGSIGREGSMVQLSAMIASRLGQLVRAPVPRLRLLVACGGAAGIAAAYNAPISGALFISEIVLGSLAMDTFGPLVVASVISDATIHRFLGYGPVFNVPHVQFASNWELGFYVVLGVLLGHLAPPFLGLIDFTKGRFVRLGLPLYWQLALGGVCVGIISIYFPQVWGNGYSVIGNILQGNLLGVTLLLVLLAKIFATSATVGSGAVGGVLTPTLFIGCAVGALVGGVLHHLMPAIVSVPAAYALIGMGSFLSATTLAPLTSILLIFEMTGDYEIVLPLMLACVSSHYTAKVYRHGKSVYHASLQGALTVEGSDDWRLRTVETLVKPAAAVVPDTMTLGEVFDQLPKRPLERVFVVKGDELVSWLNPREVLEKMHHSELDGSVPVSAVAKPVEFALAPDMPLTTALEAFLREQATVLPVTPGQWRNTLLGEVARNDLMLAIQDRLTYPK